MADTAPTELPADVDLWSDFAGIPEGGHLTIPTDPGERRRLDRRRPGGVHPGTVITVGDFHGSRCPATVTGFGADHVAVQLHLDQFRPAGPGQDGET